MLSGATLSAAAIVGTAVLRMVVSSDSMKNATATSHGSRRRLVSARAGGGDGDTIGLAGLTWLGPAGAGLRALEWRDSLWPAGPRMQGEALDDSAVARAPG